jgi:GxxExxY protein
MRVHATLGPGFLESVYEGALALELHKVGLAAARQQPIDVYYDDTRVGHFVADMVIGSRLIIELKAIQALTEAHEMQLVNYLAATHIDVGLLLNFGGPQLQWKRKYRHYQKTKE